LAENKKMMLPFDNDELPLEEEVSVPSSALCLKVPGTAGEDLVVHQERGEAYVFLFECLDDAMEYARAAEFALGFAPEIGRVRISDLNFRAARYKPALHDQHVDLVLR
jgi:hypothetical protein